MVILPEFAPGSVWLVGAGPGDPGLLTLLAAKALADADVVLHDALVSCDILALANAKALKIDAGKRCGRPSARQGLINADLIRYAREGRRVLRLKGGDPFVFGRGGEECLALAAEGIPYRVVPGVTAGIGGLAYAGIPLTHRGVATMATLVTGHGKGGSLPDDIDWQTLAKLSGTVVFYMGLNAIDAIARNLIQAGAAPNTPVAIVSNATGMDQQVIEAPLERASADARHLGASHPAIIVIGNVVPLRQAIAPFQQTHEPRFDFAAD